MITAEMVDRVLRFDSRGLPVVSLYVGVDKNPRSRSAVRSRVSALMHEIRPLTEDRSLGHEARMSLRSDIDWIERTVPDSRVPPGTLAAFSCTSAGLFEEFQLPRTVRDRVVVDTTPWVRSMLAVMDEFHRTCVAVVDRESARFWELYLGEIRPVGNVRAAALRKPDFAGWHGLLEHRVRNKADTRTRRHYRRVATVLDDLFRAEGYELLAVGGHHEDVPGFLEFLPDAVRTKVAGTFDVDRATGTVADIRHTAEAIIDRYERDEERQLVAQVMERVAVGNRGALGLEHCLWAGSVAAVQLLLVQDSAVAPGVVCDESGWLAAGGRTCPLCGGPARRTPDVIDELVETVIDAGGSIEHVLADTPLKQHMVAASLRFPLPPVPEDR
jgi:peptide chain release factor subunit 1